MNNHHGRHAVNGPPINGVNDAVRRAKRATGSEMVVAEVAHVVGSSMSGEPSTFRDMVTEPQRGVSYRRNGRWDSTTLSGRLEAVAAADPTRVAVIDRDGKAVHTYGELERDVCLFALWLGDRGVGQNDVVSIQLPNWYEFLVIALATQRMGGVINPLLPIYRRRELLHALTVAQSKVLCTPVLYRDHDHLAESRTVIADSGRSAVHVVVAEKRPATAHAIHADTVWFADTLTRDRRGGAALRTRREGERPDAVSELIFTSGTEAAPKAIMHTEETANFSVRAAWQDLGLDHTDVVWMPSPIGHSTGFNYGVRLAIYHGLTLVLQDRWDAEVACDLIAAHRASYTLASTTFLQDVVVEAERRGGDHLRSMTRFGCGGAPVPPDLVRRAAACGIGVLRLYGSTEVLVATWNRPASSVDKTTGTDGVALTGVEIELRDEDGSVCLPGVAGEILVRGPNTCVGFYGDPERTAATFAPGGWVRSGDLATMDPDGYLTVVGRKKEIIIRGGLNIAPREIEDLLLDFPEVDRAAVVGLPHERLGERVCACVVLASGTKLEFATMIERLRVVGLATYKLPERLEILDSLPLTASGKIKKYEIVDCLMGRN